MSYLKITAIGNLGQEPELKYTTDGKPVCTLSIATSEKKKDREGNLTEITTWIRVTFFSNQAENASKYLSKGKPVYIEGRGRLETWTDRDGQKRTSLEVFGTEMQFIAPRDGSGDGQRQRSEQQPPTQRVPASPTPASTLSMSDDEVPF